MPKPPCAHESQWIRTFNVGLANMPSLRIMSGSRSKSVAAVPGGRVQQQKVPTGMAATSISNYAGLTPPAKISNTLSLSGRQGES